MLRRLPAERERCVPALAWFGKPWPADGGVKQEGKSVLHGTGARSAKAEQQLHIARAC